MRGRQVHQQPRALAEAEGRPQAQVLARDVAVRKQSRFGAARGAGGEDRLRRVVLLHGGHRPFQFALRGGRGAGCQVRERHSAVDGLGRGRELNQVLHRRALPADHLPHFTKIRGGRFPQERVSSRLDQPQRAENLRRAQPQIERRVDDADLEAGVLQEDVPGEKRQGRRQVVALAESQAQQTPGQIAGGLLQGGPVERLSAIVVDDGGGQRLSTGPLGDHAVQQVTPAIVLFELPQRAERRSLLAAGLHCHSRRLPRVSEPWIRSAVNPCGACPEVA